MKILNQRDLSYKMGKDKLEVILQTEIAIMKSMVILWLI